MDASAAFAEELKRKVLDTPEGREALRQEQEAVLKEAEAEQRLKLKEKQEELGEALNACSPPTKELIWPIRRAPMVQNLLMGVLKVRVASAVSSSPSSPLCPRTDLGSPSL